MSASLWSNLSNAFQSPVKKMVEDVTAAAARSPDDEGLSESLTKLKSALFDQNVSASDAATLIVEEYPDFFPSLFRQLEKVPFEARKDLTAVFNFLLHNCGDKNIFCDYVQGNFHDMLTSMLRHIRAENPDISLLCGSMVRSLLRYDSLYEALLLNPTEYVFPFLDFAHLPNFDVASDAFTTLQEVLTTNKVLVAQSFLEKEGVFDKFNAKYNAMLMSQNYLTKRLSLKLLSDMLLDRVNFNTMMKYISDRRNLKISMLLLRDPSSNIQVEAFHVFKIFVANPSKPPEIKQILVDNKAKLVAYLETFHVDLDQEDARFRDEKSLLIATLNGMEIDIPTQA
mmetsp:Transcript_14081/g.20815  ORF Transcript_14081/g.20815 Transcript_14081/m.20815 type:complete len:340 (-) Transcript_14081:733-1752(-)